ncbi:MAG: flagellar hook-basal body complex protein [Rickettsiales bacterium]|nr:flagellar hook-basal body complex protein [Rickettsiales bacterium]
MSLYGALFAGVSGLKAQASKIGVISDNIANVNTVGYKGAESQFETLVVNGSSGSNGVYSPGGVLATTRQAVDKQGLLLATDAPTDIAISGDGFFVVNGRTDGTDVPQYTRAGSFRADSLGNFRNASGFFLQGWRLDTAGNIPTTSANLDSLETVNVDTATGDASATTAVNIGANFDAQQVIFPGESDQVTLDAISTANFGASADDILVPDEFSLAPTNSITRSDQFTINTGNGLEFTYAYGGFSIGRNVTTGGLANIGDGGVDNTTVTTLAAADLQTTGLTSVLQVTIPNHGLISGGTVTLAGVAAFDTFTAAELNSTHVVTRTGANTFTISVTNNASAGGLNGGSGTVNTRQFVGNILDATTVTETFLRGSNVSDFTSAARSFTISTPTVTTPPFTYSANSPSTVSGEFNTLTNLAQAIDEVVGLTAKVEGGRLIVGAEDANEAVTFTNGDATGTATLKGIDWVTELDIVNITTSTRRFSTLQGLNNLVNADEGVTSIISNPLSNSTLEIRVDDPLDTIQFDDFVQNPVTRLGNDAIAVLLADVTGAAGPVTVTITDPNHGFSAGQNITLAGSTNAGAGSFANFAAAELNASHVITSVIDANTYQVSITAANVAGIPAASTGGGNLIDRVQSNNGSLLAELGLVTSLNGAAYTAQTTGPLGPRYDTTGAVGQNMASGDIEAQFSRSLRIFDALGTPHDLQMSVIKVDDNIWAVEVYAVPADEVNTALVDGQIATGTVVFNGDGSLRSVSEGLTNPVDINWTNGALSSNVTFGFGTAGLPQGTENATLIGDTDGLSQFSADYNVNFVNQNGSQVGDLIGVNIDSDGIVSVSFSNGDVKAVYRLPLADFSNPNGLATDSGNVFAQTRESGEVNLREAGDNGVGDVVSSVLESSNVELSEQLTDLIVAQRAYQSNTKVITASDELLEELNRL